SSAPTRTCRTTSSNWYCWQWPTRGSATSATKPRAAKTPAPPPPAQAPAVDSPERKDAHMKMKGAKQVHYDSGPNMTPLVDIVMVILIFLMLAGNFGGNSQFLVSRQGIKKSGGMGRPLNPGEGPDTPLEIRVSNLDPTGNNPGFLATGT